MNCLLYNDNYTHKYYFNKCLKILIFVLKKICQIFKLTAFKKKYKNIYKNDFKYKINNNFLVIYIDH